MKELKLNAIVKIPRIGPFTSGEFHTYKIVEIDGSVVWAREKRWNAEKGQYFWGHKVVIYS